MQHCGKGVQVLYLITLHMNYILLRKEEETMTQKKFSTKYLVEMALLVAIILIMAFTPIGYIRTAGLEITLIVVPAPLERRVSTQARSRKTCPNPARWRKHPNMTKAKIMVEDTASGMPYSPSVTRYSCSQSIL